MNLERLLGFFNPNRPQPQVQGLIPNPQQLLGSQPTGPVPTQPSPDGGGGVLNQLVGFGKKALGRLGDPETIARLALIYGDDLDLPPVFLQQQKEILDRSLLAKQSNQTAAYLRSKGMDEYADMMEASPQHASAILTAALKEEKNKPKALAQGAVLVDPDTGKVLARNPKPFEGGEGGFGGGGLDLKDQLSHLDKMKRYADKTNSNYEAIKNAYETVKEVMELDEPNKLGDLSIIKTVAKVDDPTSTVEQGEVEAFMKSSSWDTNLKNAVAGVIGKGASLSPKMRTQLFNKVKNKLKREHEGAKETYDRMTKEARMAGLDWGVFYKPIGDLNLDEGVKRKGLYSQDATKRMSSPVQQLVDGGASRWSL